MIYSKPKLYLGHPGTIFHTKKGSKPDQRGTTANFNLTDKVD